MPSLQLEGRVQEYVDPESELREARATIRDLKLRLAHVELELSHSKQEAEQLLGPLREQLLPWYRALQRAFGEIEVLVPAGIEPEPSQASGDPRWESWKRKLGGKQAEFIHALQEHGEMTAIQLKISTHSGTSTVSDIVKKLTQLGLIDKRGSKYSLKTL